MKKSTPAPEPKVQLLARVPAETRQRAKILAMLQNRTLADIVAEALEAHLSTKESQKVFEQLAPKGKPKPIPSRFERFVP